MKRKFTFFGICVLICTLMISLGSCQKDYSEDIEKLQQDVLANKNAIASLNQAIASGKLIKTVATSATGYVITFSDNTTINVNHGQTGATGPQGPAGTPGATGFTPIIGIDAAGHWTVVTTQGGTPTKILVGGQPVVAKFSTDLGVNNNGMLTVGGVATTVYIPTIAYNEVTKKLMITVKKEDGTLQVFHVAVDADTFLKDDLVSVLSPIGISKVVIGFGNVPANNAAGYNAIVPQFAPAATKAQADAALAYAGLAYGQLVQSEGRLPIIINPAQAKLEGYTFEIIKKDGSAYAIQPEATVETGYNLPFAQFAAAPSNGLYTLVLKPSATVAATAAAAAAYPVGYPGAVAGESYELAVRATKAGREVFSGFQYAVKVQQYTPIVYAPKAGVDVVTNPGVPTVYVAVGTTKDLLDFYDKTAPAPVATLSANNFYKAGVKIMPGNSDVEPYITYTVDYSTVVSTSTTNATVTNLNDKKVPFTLKTFDRAAQYLTSQIDVVFYSTLRSGTTASYNLPGITQVLTTAAAPANQKPVMLTSLFTELDAVGKTELWRNQATNVEVKLTYGSPAVNIPGVTYEFRDANDNVIVPDAIGTWGPVLTTLAKVKDVRKIVFTFNQNTAIPGSFTGVLQFNDRRAHANTAAQMFTVNIPITIQNPDMTATINNMKEKKANLFVGDLLTVYGTYPSAVYPGATAQTSRTNAFYDIYNAYQKLYDPAVAPGLQVVPVNHWKFVKLGATPAGNPLAAGLATIATSTDRYLITEASMYTATPYDVQLWYYYFGNPANSELVETIKVQAKSEIREGSIIALVPPVASGKPATLQVVNGDLVTERYMSDYFKVRDYLAVNINAFGVNNAGAVAALDTRIDPANPTAIVANNTGVVVKNQSLSGSTTLSHLVAVTKGVAGNPNEWVVKATNAVAAIVADIEVPLTVEVTDLFGKTVKYEVKVLVKKP